jgi:hypothetical protein
VHFARETAGAARIRPSLRPLLLGERCLQKLGRIAPRDRGAIASRLFEIRIGN